MDVAESWHRALVGKVAQGRAGLGRTTTPRYEKADGMDRRVLLQEEV